MAFPAQRLPFRSDTSDGNRNYSARRLQPSGRRFSYDHDRSDRRLDESHRGESCVKALIVGAGGMGKAWARNLRDCPDVDVAGWVDIEPGRAAEAADHCEIAGLFT